MLSRLFRSEPKWQSPKSQKRIAALPELDPTQEKELQILLRLAREDSEPAVRREAVRYLHDLDILAQIQKRDLDAGVREATTARLQALITGSAPSALSLEQRLAGIRRIGLQTLLVQIVREADHIDLKLAAIDQLNDEMFLDDIARHSSIARLRLAAAERITTPALLEALAEASRQKDKNVYKAIRARLGESAQQEKDARARQEKRTALCEAMEQHARAPQAPLYAAKAESLRQQWQEAQGAEDAALAERFETAFALAWRQISDAQQAAQQAADQAQAREEMQQAVVTLEETLASFEGQEDFDLPALAALRKTQRLRWEHAIGLLAPAADLARRFDSVDAALARLEQMLAQWPQDRLIAEAALARLPQAEGDERAQMLLALQQTLAVYREFGLPLPALLREIPAPATEAVPRRRDKKEVDAAAQDALKAQLKPRLDILAASLKAGHSRDATRQLRQAQDFAQRHHLQEPRLNELAQQLRELNSWAGFAVQPKKEALIARMEALADHVMDPDDKADAIHALQEEWKALGVADPAVEQPLWARFKAAGDTAFQPCRAHFAAQRELREQNLAKREALVVQLEGYVATLTADDAAVDWKQHEAILRAARPEWQQYHPSDRHKTRPLQERFHAALQGLEQRLRAVQAGHEAHKRALIERCRALLADADLRAACDQAKQLQQEWKGIGRAHAKVDHKLWQEFRAACDALFSRRDAEFQARQAERDTAVQKAEELIQACEALSADNAQGMIGAAAELADAFAALALPREQQNPLRQRFQAAQARFAQARRSQDSQRQEEKLEQLLQSWEASAAELDGEAAVKAERLLLELEILLELPSPVELQAARRERQMQRLQERGLGQRHGDEARQLLDELLRSPPARNAQLPELSARLRQVLQKARA